jgi:hypothetical protein
MRDLERPYRVIIGASILLAVVGSTALPPGTAEATPVGNVSATQGADEQPPDEEIWGDPEFAAGIAAMEAENPGVEFGVEAVDGVPSPDPGTGSDSPVDALGSASVAAAPNYPVGPIAWGACGSSTAASKIVRTFDRTAVYNFGGGLARLRCGDSKYGYRHIQIRHQQDWQNIADYDGVNWRTAADWGMWNALYHPESSSWQSPNDTQVYEATIRLINKRTRQVVRLATVRVVVARGSKNIITSFPRNLRAP